MEIVARRYSLQPPANWPFTMFAGQSGPDGSSARSGVWHHGEPSFAGDRATMTLIFGEPRQDRAKSASAEEWCALYDASVAQGMQDFKKEALEHGTLGGMDFVRYHWSARKDKQEYKGAFYLAKDGDRVLAFSLTAPVPSDENAIRLMENAVLTVRKK